jgi:PAS domain S-box-containing protein
MHQPPATEQLAEARSYAESIVETVRKPLLVLDKDLRVKTANRSFYQTFQVGREETENAPLLSLGKGQWNIPALRTLLEDILARNTQFQDFKVDHELPTIGRRIMLLNARCLCGDDFADRMILLAIEDVTERVRAEEALRKSEERFQIIARATNDVLRDWDLLTGHVWWNQSFYSTFGYSDGEIESTIESWTNRIHPNDLERVNRSLRNLINGDRDTWSDEYRFRCRDGSYAVVFDRSYLVHDESGKPVRLLASMMDVTESRQAQEKLKLFAAKLEQSNRELQDFASVASHDLQEPLRKIQAFGDRLKAKCHDTFSEEGRDYLQRMQSAAGRMQTLINDLLMFSRVETAAQPFAEVDLALIVREVMADLEVQIEQAGASVEIGELPVIEADPLQMRQLMQNLIGNSLKYRHAEYKVRIKVQGEVFKNAREQQGDGSGLSEELCRICVADNGIGFDEKYLNRIFTVFQRLHGRKEYEGTGIGLAVCRKIVERHGGSITARSAPQQGATFIVTLPVKQRVEIESR